MLVSGRVTDLPLKIGGPLKKRRFKKSPFLGTPVSFREENTQSFSESSS